MALELDMEESWKDLIREDFPDEDSCKGETISHIQFVACFSQIRELLQGISKRMLLLVMYIFNGDTVDEALFS